MTEYKEIFRQVKKTFPNWSRKQQIEEARRRQQEEAVEAAML